MVNWVLNAYEDQRKMWPFFKKKAEPEEPVNVWKSDFSDCICADYLPAYSVCQCENNSKCRFVVRYSGMVLCSHPAHKEYIPEGAERFDPHRGQFG